MSQKGFAPILIVLLIGIVAAGIGGAYYSGFDHGWEKSVKVPTSQTIPAPSQNLTANWKTFESERCSFGLKYPNNWIAQIEIKDVEPTHGAIQSGSAIATKGFGVSCAYMYIPILGVDYKDLSRSYVNDFYIHISRTIKGSRFYPSNLVINSLDDFIRTDRASEIESRDIAGFKGKYYKRQGPDPSTIVLNLIFERGDYIYSINWSKRTEESYEKELKLIISSLQFSQ